ncbi:uncharacterized protein LOC132044581 [Lycium ferocissimum]|uniref:uncharacterized protein LOC132044581 n=1 Tax=Lycium ferocissimum TaxID=112874 RepID=UPI002814C42E|nr:uncharacterized protein LOC132044581 [Lycium ferocissimum]
MLDEKFKGLHIHPLIAEDDGNFLNMDYKVKVAAYINKIDEYYADKHVQGMYYYPRPTLQDILLEKHEHVITNSDSDIIIAGFIGQLKGWWDGYLTQEQRANILNAIKREQGTQESVIVPNVVYLLVINIIDHFSGRWSDNNETIRTMLQNLRCKNLTSFRWYKDVFLCRVMELPECNNTHWKSKFIDGLPTLFAERVRKSLRKGEIKRHGLNERQQLGEFYGQFGMDIPQTKAPHRHKEKNKDFQAWKEKRLQKKARRKKEFKKRKDYERIKSLDIDDDQKESLYKLLLNLEPEDSGFKSDKSEDSSSNEDIRVHENESYTSTSSDEECAPCQMGQPYTSKDGNNLVDLLKIIKDPKLRYHIIDKVNEAPKEPEMQTDV